MGFAVCVFLPIAAAAQASEAAHLVRYFEQLRKRRLFSVAEQLGMDRLSAKGLKPADEILLTIELSKTYAEHARFTSGQEHDEYWELAESVIDEAIAKHRQHPRGLLLEVQKSFIPAKRGEFLRGQIEMFPYDKPLRTQTGKIFDTALEQLRPLEKALAKRHLQAVGNRQNGARDLATYEIHDLHEEARFQLAIALQESAKAMESFLPARTHRLKEAARWLVVLCEAREGDPFKDRATILLAENYRLQGDLYRADNALKELEVAPPAILVGELMAERTRWRIANHQLAEAAQELSAFQKRSTQNAGELAYLEVEVLIGLWEQAITKRDLNTAARLLNLIKTNVEKMQTTGRGYWAFRTNLLWEQLQKVQKYGIQTAEIVRQAEAHYAARETDAAVEDYQRAATMAFNTGKPDVAFDLGYTAASVLVQLKNYSKAQTAFEQLVKTYPKHTKAANANLLSAYCLGKLYETSSTQINRENYASALTGHTATYPNHATTGDAYWMIGQLEEQRQQITSALKAYRQVSSDHRRSLTAHLAVARCYEKVFKRLKEVDATAKPEQKPELDQRTKEWENAAETELNLIIESYPKSPNPFNSEQAEVAMQLARFRLSQTEPSYRKADAVLERILASGTQQLSARPELSEAEQTTWLGIVKTSRQLRIVTLAGQGESQKAEQLVKDLANSSTQEVLGVMDGLMQVAASVDLSTQRKLKQIQLQTALELHSRRDQLTPAEQQRLDHCRAQAYLATNQPTEALKVYDQMIVAQPKNQSLRMTVAKRLSEGEDRTCLLKAKAHFRAVESSQKPGSVMWLEMRYHIARCCLKLGQTEECRKLLGVTGVLYPELGTDALKARYAELQAELDK